MTRALGLFFLCSVFLACGDDDGDVDASVDDSGPGVDGAVDGGSDGAVDVGPTADSSVDAATATCDPLAADGCDDGEKCGGFFPSADPGTEPSATMHVCAPDGDVAVGDSCSLSAVDGGAVDDCEAGSICMPTPDGSACFAICDPDDGSSCSVGQPLCQVPFAAGPIGICAQCSGEYVTQEKTDQVRMYYDFSHNQDGAPQEAGGPVPLVAMEQFATLVRGRDIQLSNINGGIVDVCLSDADVLFISTPRTVFSDAEKTAVIDYVNGGGRLLFSIDDDVNSDLVMSQSNDILSPFGMSFDALCTTVGQCDQGAVTTADNPITDTTPIAITYIFGRTTTGGTSFININTAGGSAGAYAEIDGGGRVVTVSENTPFIDFFIDTPGTDNRGFMNAIFDWLLE